MAIQYITVKFPRKRTVLVDGEEHGQTGAVLRVGEGVHTIKLAGELDYTPQWRRPTVTGTNQFAPMEVTFAPVED